MIKRLIETLLLEDGELYGIVRGRRVLLARCEPKVEVYEHSTDVPVLGAQGYREKKRQIGMVLCPSPDTTRRVDEDFLRTVTRFEVSADIQREDGIFEKIRFDNLMPDEINLDGDWKFEVGNNDIIKRLLAL